MTSLSLRSSRSGLILGRRDFTPASEAMPRAPHDSPCGGERVIDFALCLVVAVAIVSLLILAL